MTTTSSDQYSRGDLEDMGSLDLLELQVTDTNTTTTTTDTSATYDTTLDPISPNFDIRSWAS
jgi:hypothetical protein